MGCHCRADRSFYYKGNKFPVCARCTGILAGVFTAAVTCFLYKPPCAVLLPCLVPLMADGLAQKLVCRYESRNSRRFLTGIAFGWGVMNLHLNISAYVFQWGQETGMRLMSAG